MVGCSHLVLSLCFQVGLPYKWYRLSPFAQAHFSPCFSLFEQVHGLEARDWVSRRHLWKLFNSSSMYPRKPSRMSSSKWPTVSQFWYTFLASFSFQVFREEGIVRLDQVLVLSWKKERRYEIDVLWCAARQTRKISGMPTETQHWIFGSGGGDGGKRRKGEEGYWGGREDALLALVKMPQRALRLNRFCAGF